MRLFFGRLAPLFASGTRDKVKEPPRVSPVAALLHMRMVANSFYLFYGCLSIGRFKIPLYFVCRVFGQTNMRRSRSLSPWGKGGGNGGCCFALHFAKFLQRSSVKAAQGCCAAAFLAPQRRRRGEAASRLGSGAACGGDSRSVALHVMMIKRVRMSRDGECPLLLDIRDIIPSL